MSSRICVKNLTKNTVEKDLSGLFGTRGEITDVKIVRTPTGKSRQFGFIGFRTHEQAKDCQEYFNNTFLKSARISVEFAVRLGDPGLPTKHRKSAKTAETTQIDSKTDSKKDLTKLKKQAKVVVAPAAVTDSAKGEFMSVMKARGKGQFWTNDDINSAAIHGGPVPVVRGRKRSNSESSVGSDSDSSYDDEAGLTSAPAVALTAAVSDMSYLQSKRRQMTEDSSDSDEDSGDDAAVRESFPDQESVDAPVTAEEPAESAIEEETDESRLFIRNLPFSCSEEELTELFIKFGPLTQVHIPLADAGDGRGKGFAFVQFMIPEHASNARALLDGTSFQGRLLHIIKAKKAFEPITDAADMAAAAKARKMSSYQLKKEEERKKSAGIKEGWNASHIRSDTVIEATAEKYGVSRADIMDTSKVSGGELAVRLAISETQILQENREYFEAHGVDISALESATSTNKTIKRSNTTILVKNLPYDLVSSELEDLFAKYGALSAFLVPKSKSVALVDFTEPVHARAALKGLAYRRYHHTPLYLEWAPLNVVKRTVDDVSEKERSTSKSKASVDQIKSVEHTEGADNDESFSTLYVKNLSFSTTEDMIRDHLNKHGLVEGVRAISLPRKTQGDRQLPMGFGFIEFKSPQIGSTALSRLPSSVLDGRTLEFKPSNKRISVLKPMSANAVIESSKLLVRNVAFQATQKEIRDLFSAFGSVKRVRIPKKMGGEHRGFAFVDFGSSKEAKAAKEALANTHLYGRHLVLEWASEEETSMEALRKRSQLDMSAIRNRNLNKKQRTDGADPFAAEDDIDMM